MYDGLTRVSLRPEGVTMSLSRVIDTGRNSFGWVKGDTGT